MSNYTRIGQMKDDTRKNLELHAKNVRDYRDEHDNLYSDYLVYHLQMEEYYRGKMNGLIEVEREYDL